MARKIGQKIVTALAVCVCGLAVIAGIGAYSANAYETGGESGGGSGSSGGSCAPAGSTKWSDTCFGATWKKYTADSDHITIPPSQGGGTKGGTITNCLKYGGEYYRLGLELYNPRTMQRYYEQVGLVPVRQIRKWLGYGEGSWAGTQWNEFSDTENWDEVYENFMIAKKKGYVSTEWADTAWFCWYEGWKSQDSAFSATTNVAVEAQPGLGAPVSAASDPDGDTSITVRTTAETTDIKFWHNISYDGAMNFPLDATAPDVSTYWTVYDDKTNQLLADNNFKLNARGANVSGKLGESTVTVKLQPGETQTVCHTISYRSKTIGFSLAPGSDNVYQPDYRGDEEDSKGCITVIRTPDGYVDDCEFTGTCPKGDAEFYSTSTVSINDVYRNEETDNGSSHAVIDVPAQSDTSDIDGTQGSPDSEDSMNNTNKRAGWLAFSVDYNTTSVNVDFWHNITYNNNFSFANNDVVEKASTVWSITGSAGSTGSGTFTVENSKQNQTSSNLTAVQQTVQVDLPKEGETYTVCQSISYQPKFISFYVTGDHDGWLGHAESHSYYDYGIKVNEPIASNRGGSQACVQITRRKRPEGVPYLPGDGDPTGLPSSNILYAGEPASPVGWSNLQASGSLSNRLKRFESITYLVPPNVEFYDGITKGRTVYTTTSSDYPCTYYKEKSEVNWCQIMTTSPTGGLTIYTGKHSISIAIATPDLVGYKYCNSAGWFWEGWKLVCGKNGCYWVRNPSADHWYVYNAACRAIAKKPSVAFWNGGVYSSGMIKGVTSSRYSLLNDASVGQTLQTNTPALGSQMLFGSWSEHLSISGQAISNFSSGSAISRGNDASTTIAASYSTLSISNDNTDAIGYASVQPNNALLTRLDTYLSTPLGVSLSSINDIDTSKNQVFIANGGLKITKNIVTSGSYSNIYQIPRTVIFVNGDVEVDPSVTQVDAWIIATGKIKTCQGTTSSYIASSIGSGVRGTSTITNVQSKMNVPANEAPVCENQLVFNGAVIASGVDLKRTHGSDPATGTERYTPAEVFNLSADNYLWAYAQAGRYSSSYTEAYTRELAPRY